MIPQGGLCNRLRVVLSALAVSELGADVRVGWSATRECRARFADLFEPLRTLHPDAPSIAEAEADGSFRITERHWYDVPQSRRNLHLPALLRRLRYERQLVNYRGEDAAALLAFARAHKSIYVSTGYALCRYAPDMARLLTPVEPLRAEVARLTSAFDAHTVGVHVRRTDNAVSIAHSPLDAFVQAMQATLAADPAAHFFLATDDPAVRTSLRSAFPGRISCQEISAVRRDTLSGVRQAVVDLFCLARAPRLLGSYWSSFSDMAAEIGGHPLRIAGGAS